MSNAMNKTDIKAVIFDMDGVIVDSEPLQVESFNETLSSYNVYLSKDEFKKYVGRTQKEIFGQLKELYGIEESIESLITRKREKYFALIHRKLEVMPGVKDLVKWLRSLELKTGVASSSPLEDIRTVLSCIHLDGEFDEVLSALDLPHGKPDPTVFLKTAEKLQVEPINCIVLEDSGVGVTAAKRAGMKCIAIPNFFTVDQDFSLADFVVKDFDDVKQILIGLIGKE